MPLKLSSHVSIQVNFFIGAFYDGVLLLGMALNETLTEGGDLRDGAEITRKMWGCKPALRGGLSITNFTYSLYLGGIERFKVSWAVASPDIYGHLTTSTAGKLKIISRLYGHLNIKLVKLLNGFCCSDDI